MAVVEQGLRALLVANAGVNALVAGRIYPQTAPAGAALPAIVYSRISGPRLAAHDGPSGVAHPRFQFDCKATTYAGARGLANAVRVALDGYQGTTGDVTFQAILVQDEADGYDFESDASASAYEVYVDAVVWHIE